jgi:hypothetical protein
MTELIAVAAVVIVAWFAAGTIWNIHKGRTLMQWMHGGLPMLGERTSVRWLGSSAIEMVIREGKAPFASVTLVSFLEPRDTPWMWALARLRGRRDTLIIRGVLRQPPAAELEILDPASWSGREALPRVPKVWQMQEPTTPGGLVVHHENAAGRERGDGLLAQVRQAGLTVRRLSVRRTEPNFQIHVAWPDDGQPARDFFQAVHALAHRAIA